MAGPLQKYSAGGDSPAERYVANRKNGESFKDFVKRIGKVEIKGLLEDRTRLSTDDTDRSHFSDWGYPREYSSGDLVRG